MKRFWLVLSITSLLWVSVSAAVDDQPLKILKKPRPTAKGCAGPGGSAIVRVTFKSDATIGETEMVTPSACEAFNDSVLQIVHEIEFEPATKDGRPVTVTKQLEYVFAIY